MFRVPEAGRLTLAQHPTMGSDSSYGNNGAFQVESPESGWVLFLICSDGADADALGELAHWEHVSVSARGRTVDQFRAVSRVRVPTWKEMCYVKRLCWEAEDVVVQYHPAASQYVNVHPSVLHLWRWRHGTFPVPPMIAV